MSEIKYCKYCGQDLDEGSTFCVYCQLDSKDFRYDIASKDLKQIKLGEKMTKQVRIVAIFSIAFTLLSTTQIIAVINPVFVGIVLGLLFFVCGIFALKNVVKDGFKEKPFIIAIMVIDVVYLFITIIDLFVAPIVPFYVVHLVSLFIHLVGFIGSIIIALMYLINLKEYKKKYLK